MMPTYNDIQKLLFSQDFTRLAPEGLFHSEPIPSMCANGIVDNYFVMKKSDGIAIPIYKFGICYDTKNLEYLSEYKNVNIQLTQKCQGLNYEEYKKYTDLYGTVRAMFSKAIPVCQENIKEYLSLLSRLTDSHLFLFYSDLSTEFFSFLNSSI